MSGRPLRIGYLTSVYGRASDTFVRSEVAALRAKGHAVFTYSIRRPDPAQVVSPEVRREVENTTYVLPDHAPAVLFAVLACLVARPLRFLGGLRLAWRTGRRGIRGRLLNLAYLAEATFLAGRLRRDGVEHLHDHLGESSATVAMLAGHLSGIPYSMAIHGPYLFRAPVEWALGEKIARSRFTTCITEFTRSQCMIYAPVTAWPKLVIVRCGPDRSFLDAAVEPLPDEPNLVWVGRICEEKGVPVLIEAASRLAMENVPFRLQLLGDGPLREEMEREVRANGLADRVRFHGWASSDEVREAVVDSRLLCLPSFAEGLPVVLMEALALGRPVVSTWIAGIPELVEHGRTGWLVPAGSVDALADALRTALCAPKSELAALGREGRARVLERHDVEVQVGVLESWIRATVEGGAAPRADADEPRSAA